MVSIRSSVFFIAATSALALQGHADAAACDADSYSKVATAVQTLHSNCASWAAYLASGGVWTCDSTCRDAVANLVDTLPDCTFGGPYGQNYKQVVEGMVATCNGVVSAGSDSTAAPTSTAAAPADSTATPTATTVAPTANASSSSNNSTESATPTTTTAPSTTTSTDNKDPTDKNTTASTNTSTSAGAADTPASDVATTSGASSQTANAMAALVLVVVGSLLH